MPDKTTPSSPRLTTSLSAEGSDRRDTGTVVGGASDKTTDDYNRAAFGLIVALRGGVLPDKCDFCDQPYAEQRYPVPEEAGEWTCSECVARWMKDGTYGV